ncbi:MAG: pitrilysin family protein [Vicinamibacterales bacterium]
MFQRVLSSLVLTLSVASVAAAQAPTLDIPYKKFVLPNGLTLIVHEDHKAPIVAVNVWYHVGSKNEKPGKTGFAHLFEHLMFNGSEHFNDDYFQVLERIGGTNLNGTTNEDRTNYFQNVPTSALDTVLWLESDRMGHLLGAIDQAKLDEQRGVVQNEKREGENQPYSIADELTTQAAFPKGHPYSWTVIGSMDDLNAASLDDVKEWFKTYYGAANAVLVVAGDIDTETVHRKVQQYFGEIPAGPPVARVQSWVAKRTGTIRQIAQDRVPQSRVYKVWNIPAAGSTDEVYLDLVSDVLSLGKSSRLYQRLVYRDQIATDAAAFLDAREIAGLFTMQSTARPGGDLRRVEQALDEELAGFIANGPTAEELERVKTQAIAGFVRSAERIGGFGGKSDLLARAQVFEGNPDAYRARLDLVQKATAKDLQDASRRWLSDGVYVLEIHPFPAFKTDTTQVDRTKMPEPGAPPPLKFPALQRATLANGLKIVLAERHEQPLVDFRLLVDAGYAADQFSVPGAAKLAMNMLDEGTTTKSSLEIANALERLAVRLGTGSDLDTSFVNLSTLKSTLEPALALFADVVLNPSFPVQEFDRLRQEQAAAIQREKVSPTTMALRVFPSRLYGDGHPYGTPFTGSGTAESLAKLTLDDLKKFHQSWFKPNNATLVVAGDITMKEVRPLVEKAFASWKAGDPPKKIVRDVAQQPRTSIYIIDRPGAIQSTILVGHLAPPKANPQEIAIETMNNVLGGLFISRLNMNLREDKHWSYGASSFIVDAKGQRPFIAFAQVQADKTKESMTEMLKELKEITGTRPISNDEFRKAQENQTLSLPGSQETVGSVAGSLGEIVRFGLPDDYFQTYPQKVDMLTTNDANGAAKSVLQPDRLVWVVVGDAQKIESGIKELGFGAVARLDADGRPAAEPPQK